MTKRKPSTDYSLLSDFIIHGESSMSKSDRPTAAIIPEPARSAELEAAFKSLLDLPYQELGEFETKLRRLREERSKAEREKRRAACPRAWTYQAAIVTDRWNEIRECSNVVQIRISGKVTNVEACKAAGYSDDELSGGSMIYLFNAENGKFIGSVGGGNIYIRGSGGGSFGKGDELKANADRVYTQIEDLIREQGGTEWDITDIILAQSNFKSW